MKLDISELGQEAVLSAITAIPEEKYRLMGTLYYLRLEDDRAETASNALRSVADRVGVDFSRAAHMMDIIDAFIEAHTTATTGDVQNMNLLGFPALSWPMRVQLFEMDLLTPQKIFDYIQDNNLVFTTTNPGEVDWLKCHLVSMELPCKSEGNVLMMMPEFDEYTPLKRILNDTPTINILDRNGITNTAELREYITKHGSILGTGISRDGVVALGRDLAACNLSTRTRPHAEIICKLLNEHHVAEHVKFVAVASGASTEQVISLLQGQVK